MPYVYDITSPAGKNFAIDWDRDEAIIFATGPGNTTAQSIETYNGDLDGLSTAIARAHYLAGDRRRDTAGISVAAADRIMRQGPKAAHDAWIDMPDIKISPDGEPKPPAWKPLPKLKHDNHLEIRNGDLWGPRGHICDGSQLFGVLMDADPQAPMLLKYGSYPSVAEYAENMWSQLQGHAQEDVQAIARHIDLLALPVHPEIVEKLNCCLECSGRIGHFKGFLEDLQRRHPEMKVEPYQLLDLGQRRSQQSPRRPSSP